MSPHTRRLEILAQPDFTNQDLITIPVPLFVAKMSDLLSSALASNNHQRYLEYQEAQQTVSIYLVLRRF